MSFPVLARVSVRSFRSFAIGCLTIALFLNTSWAASAETAASRSTTTVWTLDNVKQIGGQTPTVEGNPKIVRDDRIGASIQFDGNGDGLVMPINPLAGLSQFTIEILFRPAAGGLAEQRFLHVQDEGGRRALIELRLNPQGKWWLDTYLKPSVAAGVPLIDPAKTHPADHWYWAALRFDGKHMASFVNGEKELEGEPAFDPMGPGHVSVGVRLNRVSWFKGMIHEVRFHAEALPPEKLQRVK
jgi:hypothetical protein